MTALWFTQWLST